MTIPDKPKEFLLTAVPAILYSCLSLAYFTIFDSRFYAKNALDCGITFVFPIPYIILVAVFIFLYSALLRKDPRGVSLPVIAMAVVLPLFYLLTEFKIGMRSINPFGGTRGIYGVYAEAYFFALIAVFSASCGFIFREIIKGRLALLSDPDSRLNNFAFHLPVLIYFSYIEWMFFSNGFIVYALCALCLFLAALLFKEASALSKRLSKIIVRFAQNEKLFLICIFIIAFLARYFWGERLLGITGSRFIMASDDGACYDEFAAILAGGRLIPKESLYSVSGFGYWYFLAAVYKIFGPHNFRAAFVIQSFMGALVPIFTYLMVKMIFKARRAAALAGLITSLDMTLIFLSVVIGMEAVYIPLVALSLTMAVYLLSIKGLDYKKALLLGIVLGLAYNCRPPELLLFPAVIAFIIYIFMKGKLPAKDMARVFIALFAGFLLLASLQYTTNLVFYGERRAPLPNGLRIASSMGVDEGFHTDENKILAQMGFSIFSDFKGSMAVFCRHPATVSRLVITGFFNRTILLYFYPNFGVFDPLYLVNPSSGYFFRFPVLAQFLSYLLVAAGICLALIKRPNAVGIAILLAFLIYRSSGIAFCFVLNSRYRGALIPICIAFFAYAAWMMYEKTKGAYEKGSLTHAD